jgi:uncharacterized protein (TIGR02246 family)
MTADVVFLVAGQPPMKGRQAFENGLRCVLETQRIESAGDIQEIQVSGDLAYCWSFLNVRMFPLSGGEPTERDGHVMSVLRKQPSGSWQISRVQTCWWRRLELDHSFKRKLRVPA